MSVKMSSLENRRESEALRKESNENGFEVARCWPAPDSRLEKALKMSGWGSGFKLPFASEENKALEKELERKQNQVLDLSSACEDHDEHLKTLKKHYMRVQYDNLVTQSLLTAKLAEIKSEEKTTGYAERVCSKWKAERRTDDKKIADIQQRVHSKLNEVERRTEQVKDLLSISEFNEAALRKWKEHTALAGQDVLYVKFFAKADEKNQAVYEKKELDLSTKKRELSEMLSNQSQETLRLQEVFARTKREFVKAHKERQQTINSWTNAIKALKRRELEMEILGNDYCIARQHLRNRNAKIWETEKSLQTENRTKKETVYAISKLERAVRDLHEKMGQVQQMYSSLYTETSNFQADLSVATGELASAHKRLRKHDEDMRSILERSAKLEAEVIVLQSKHETISSHKCDSEIILEQMHVMLQDHEVACAHAREQKKRFRQFHWERSNQKSEVESEYKLVLKNIHAARTRLNYNVVIGQREEILLQRLTSELFHYDLTCTQLTARMSRLTNEALTTSYIANQSKLKDLKERIDVVLLEKRLVHREVTHDESIRMRLERHIFSLGEKGQFKQRILQDLMLDCSATGKQLQISTEALKSNLVSLQLQKVALKRMCDDISNNQESICDLTQYRLLLQGAVKDRKLEIDSLIEVHNSNIKTIKDNILKLKSYLTDVVQHLSKQKKAFSTLSSLLSVDPSSPNASGFSSFTATVLQVVQEREMLNKEKTTWEQKVQEAEKELRGLENNVKLMETSNCHFKSSLAPATEQSTETEKVQKAEAVRRAVELRKKHSTKAMLKCRDMVNDLENANQVLKNHVDKMSVQCEEKARAVSRLTNAVISQRDKITRWANLSFKLLQDVRGAVPFSQLMLVQLDLKLRCLLEKLEFAVLMIEKLILVFPDSKDPILGFLTGDAETAELGARVSHTLMKHHSHDSPNHNQNNEGYVHFVDQLYGEVPVKKTALKNQISSGYLHY